MSLNPSSAALNQPLSNVDFEILHAIEGERLRQENTLEMIASENFASVAVMEAQGSVFTNKYAEGYPGRRYYGGCGPSDIIEDIARNRLKEIFGADHVNVQPHSGAQANAAVMMKLLKPGDTILGLNLAHGGHLTHGMKLNYSGMLYNVAEYGVNKDTYLIDMDEVRKVALESKPQMIIAGWSAYPRQLDFAAFRAIADEVGALLFVDMSHFAGLVAAGLHPSPVPYADVITSTTHKTLSGPRGGVIMCKSQYAKKIDSGVFPGTQGGPLMHVIAAKAVAFKQVQSPEFHDKQVRTLEGASILAQRMMQEDAKNAGIDVLTGGTDVHLVLADLRNSRLGGTDAENLLHEVGITVNRNSVPFDTAPPMNPSGLRIGTPALATRGFQKEDFIETADILTRTLIGENIEPLKKRVAVLTRKFPLYY